ncbi:MAG: hypothetical protein AAB036_12015 [Elusimicrobiota bacterium]
MTVKPLGHFRMGACLFAATCACVLTAPARSADPMQTTLDERLYDIANSSDTPKVYQDRLKRLLKTRENQRLAALKINQKRSLGLASSPAKPQKTVNARTAGAAMGGMTGIAASTDLNGNGVTDASDVQLAINQARGLSSCSTGDINKDGACDVADIQLIVVKALER